MACIKYLLTEQINIGSEYFYLNTLAGGGLGFEETDVEPVYQT